MLTRNGQKIYEYLCEGNKRQRDEEEGNWNQVY